MPALKPSDLAALARRSGTPLVEPDGLRWVWLGGDAPPDMVGDWSSWHAEGRPAWTRAGAGEVWTAHLALEPDAFIEYAFQRDGRREPDPLATATVRNGIGAITHQAWMPDAPREARRLARARRPEAPAGTTTEHVVETFGRTIGGRRRIWLHRPSGVEPAHLPLLVVLDGTTYRRVGLARTLEHLVHTGRMAPVVTAFAAEARGDDRMVEYMGSEMTLAFLVEDVVGLARRELGLADPWRDEGKPGSATILGASAGGLMALTAGLRLPNLFGRVLAQSGAWEFGGHELGPVLLVRHGPVRPIRIWMDVGRYESLFEPNERMAALLAERGYDVTYRRYPGGHNHTIWAEELLVGLPALLPADAGARRPDGDDR
jgi:enterochelin esterase family protein